MLARAARVGHKHRRRGKPDGGPAGDRRRDRLRQQAEIARGAGAAEQRAAQRPRHLLNQIVRDRLAVIAAHVGEVLFERRRQRDLGVSRRQQRPIALLDLAVTIVDAR